MMMALMKLLLLLLVTICMGVLPSIVVALTIYVLMLLKKTVLSLNSVTHTCIEVQYIIVVSIHYTCNQCGYLQQPQRGRQLFIGNADQ